MRVDHRSGQDPCGTGALGFACLPPDEQAIYHETKTPSRAVLRPGRRQKFLMRLSAGSGLGTTTPTPVPFGAPSRGPKYRRVGEGCQEAGTWRGVG